MTATCSRRSCAMRCATASMGSDGRRGPACWSSPASATASSASAAARKEWRRINTVVPDDQLKPATREMALEIAERGAFALASIKTAFSARHGGVGGLARLAHDLLLRQYLDSEESHELGAAFAERRKPDPDKFGH